MITLDQVRSLVAVAEELHFGRAAERLRMTQPPLSRQIQKLEKSVGARLLERDNRRVELTGAGAAFLDEAYRLLNLVEGAGDLARRVDAGAAGVVRLGFTAVSAISILGPLLRRLTAELPDVDLLVSLPEPGVVAAPTLPHEVPWADLLAAGASVAVPVATCPTDHPLMIAFTSGTTGQPKGVTLGHVGFGLKAGSDAAIDPSCATVTTSEVAPAEPSASCSATE